MTFLTDFIRQQSHFLKATCVASEPAHQFSQNRCGFQPVQSTICISLVTFSLDMYICSKHTLTVFSSYHHLTCDGISQVIDSAKGILGGDVSTEAPLMAAGLDSLGASELRKALSDRTGLDLPTTVVFDYPTITALSDFIEAQTPSREQQLGRLHGEGAAAMEGTQHALSAHPQRSSLQTEQQQGQSSYAPAVLCFLSVTPGPCFRVWGRV